MFQKVSECKTFNKNISYGNVRLIDHIFCFDVLKHKIRIVIHCTKMKFSIKDFFSKCDQIRSFLRIWSHLLKKSLMENFIFCPVILTAVSMCFSLIFNILSKLSNVVHFKILFFSVK